MIQAYTESNFKAYLSTEDNRIDTSVAKTQIRHLVKLINDMDGSIDYVYPSETINNRFTEMTFTYESDALIVDLWAGEVHLLPAGYWKYEVYEVSWSGTVTVLKNFAPQTETDPADAGAFSVAKFMTITPSDGVVKPFAEIPIQFKFNPEQPLPGKGFLKQFEADSK